MMSKLKYKIGKGVAGYSDGLEIWDDRVIIKQRMGGDRIIPIKQITEVGTNRSMYDLFFVQQSLRFVAGGKQYVVRRLLKKQADEAKEMILSLLSL